MDTGGGDNRAPKRISEKNAKIAKGVFGAMGKETMVKKVGSALEELNC